MASLAGTTSGADAIVALSRLGAVDARSAARRPARAHARVPRRRRARADVGRSSTPRTPARRGSRAAGGQNAASDALAAHVYAADVVAGLAAEGELDADRHADHGRRAGRDVLDPARGRGASTSSCAPSRARSCSSCRRSSPPRSSSGCCSTSTSRPRSRSGAAPTTATSSASSPSAPTRPTGRSAPRRGRRSPAAPASARPALDAPHAPRSTASATPPARSSPASTATRGRDVRAYLDVAATALSPLLERELLLERNAARERALLGTAENRLTRLGFDLHDGPVQDVLALGAETRQLRDQVYPFVLESHRELVYGRFDDLLARLVELDRQLRETAHSLETKSIVSRPLAEILHREVEAFAERTGIEALARRPGRSRVAQPAAARRGLPGDPGVALERARAQRRDDGRGAAPGAPQHGRRARHRQRPRLRGQPLARARGASAAASASSAWASACACSAARSRSTAAPAARRRSGSRCRAGSRSRRYRGRG